MVDRAPMETLFDEIFRMTTDGRVGNTSNHIIEYIDYDVTPIDGSESLYEVSFYKMANGEKYLSEKAILNKGQLDCMQEETSHHEARIENIMSNSLGYVSHKVKTVNLGHTEEETNFIRERYVVIETQSATNEEI